MGAIETIRAVSLDDQIDWAGCDLQDAQLGSPVEEIHENYPDFVDFGDSAAYLVCAIGR